MLIEQTEQIAALNEALARAQQKMGHAHMDGLNPHFTTPQRKAKYATLASVIDAIREPLSSEGIAFMQFPAQAATGQVCVTRLSFKDQWVQATMPILGEVKGMQAQGSAYTYARRYSLMMIVGVAADDDDDGEAAEGRQPHDGGQQQRGQRGQDRGRGGQASPGPSRGDQGSAPAQGGGQDSPPAGEQRAAPADPKLAEEAKLLRKRRAEAAQEKNRDKLLQADTAFAAFVETHAATMQDEDGLEALASACRELKFPKGTPAEAIGTALNQARARIAAAQQTT